MSKNKTFLCAKIFISVLLGSWTSAWAQNGITASPPGVLFLVPGNYDEKIVFLLHLDDFGRDDGGLYQVSPPDCEYSAIITASEPTGTISPIVGNVALMAGEMTQVEFSFSQFVSSGPGLAIIKVSDVSQRGPCRLFSQSGVTESSTDIVKAFMHRRADMLLSEEPDTTRSMKSNNRFVVAGDSGKSWVASLYLNTLEPVDGGFKLVAPMDCEYSATFTASDPTGNVSPVVESVELMAGEATHVEVAFSHFVSSGPALVIIEVSDANKRGACRLDVAERLAASLTGETELVIIVTPWPTAN